MARPSNTAERRAEIAEGLLEVMAREWYERATVASIARAAKLTPGLVHYHYETKDEILLELIALLRSRVRARYEARLKRCGDDPRDRLHALIDAHVALGEDADPRAVAAWVAIGAEAVSQPKVRTLYRAAIEDLLDELTGLVAACSRARGCAARDAKAISAALLAAIEGAYLLSAAAPGLLPPGYAAPALRRMVRGLLDDPRRTRRSERAQT